MLPWRWQPLMAHNLYSCFGTQPISQLIRVLTHIDNPAHAGVDQHFRTQHTRAVCTVNGGPFRAHTMQGRLDNCVLFGVNAAAKLMSFARLHPLRLPQTTHITTVSQSGRRTVVARCQYMPVLYENSADRATQAGSPARHLPSDLQEVVVPRRPFTYGIRQSQPPPPTLVSIRILQSHKLSHTPLMPAPGKLRR